MEGEREIDHAGDLEMIGRLENGTADTSNRAKYETFYWKSGHGGISGLIIIVSDLSVNLT